MSARPDVPRLAEEDLDLLISRSLDGDLSPEEEQQLERLVALDPAAARRKAELAALVADVKALPEPATPFALATRVNSNVAERAGRPGSLGGRVGFFPAPGFMKAALVILGVVGASIAILRPAPRRLAEGPVDVFLYAPTAPSDASRPASPTPATRIAEAKPAARAYKEIQEDESSALGAKDAEKDAGKINAKEKSAKEAGDRLHAAGDLDATLAKRRDEPARQAAASEEGRTLNESADGAKEQAKSELTKPDVADKKSLAKLESARENPRSESAASNAFGAAGAVAPQVVAQAPAPAARAKGDEAAPRGWTVSIRGDAVRRWSLRRAPDNPPPARGTAVYRVTLDASGAVTALSRVGAGSFDPRLDAFVRGMVFAPVVSPAEVQAQGTAAKSAASSGSSPDFEIELAPR